MTTPVDLNDLLETEQAAKLLGIKKNTLEIWRHRGKGPPFVKLGTSPQAPVRYLRSAVMAWLAQQSFPSTSAYSPAALMTATSHKCRSADASA